MNITKRIDKSLIDLYIGLQETKDTVMDLKEHIRFQVLEANIPLMTAEELRELPCSFFVEQEDGKWGIYMSICYFGGCDYDFVPYSSEKEALVAAVRLTLAGKRPKHTFPCPRCYKEHIGI